jgi:hypothetical protein
MRSSTAKGQNYLTETLQGGKLGSTETECGHKEKQMRHLKMFSFAALSAMALMAPGAGTASATTMEVEGATQNKAITLEMSSISGWSTLFAYTSRSFIDTCTSSAIKGSTEGSFTGTTVGGNISSMTFSNCTHATKVVQSGSFTVEHLSGTTKGTVRSTGLWVEVASTSFGLTHKCTTLNTHLGTLSGSLYGHASLSVNAVLNCGSFAPTANWEGLYRVTSPTGLGVSA